MKSTKKNKFKSSNTEEAERNTKKFAQENKFDRRRFLAVSTGAAIGGIVGGVIVGAVGGYLAGSQAAPAVEKTVTKTTTVRETVTQTATATATTPSAPRVIKIGNTVSETGMFAAAVGPQGKMWKAAEEIINAMGGIYVDEYKTRLPIKIIYYDDTSDPAKVERFYTKLITEDQVDILIGPFTAVNAIPAAAVAERHGVPYIDNQAAERPIFGKEWVVGSLDLVEKWFKRYFEMASYYRDEKGYDINTFAFANTDEPFGNEVHEWAKQEAERRGFKVVAHEKYTFETTDFTPIVTKIKEANPDVLIITDPVGPLGAQLWRQGAEQGLRPKEVHISFGLLRATRETLGTALSDGLTAEDWVPPEIPAHGIIPKWVYEKVQEKAGFTHEDYPWVTISWLCLEIALSAIQVAGSLNKDKVRDALWNMRVMTSAGEWYVPKDDPEIAGHGTVLPYPIQFIGGKKRILWPPDVATGDWVYPVSWKF